MNGGIIFLCYSYDSLTITNEKSHSFGVYCGQKAEEVVLVEGDHAVITFHSDDNNVTKKGFLISFTAVKLSEYPKVNTALGGQMFPTSKQN